MPVLKKIVPFMELEEFNTTSIDMGTIGNKALSAEYYNIEKFTFTDAYKDFLGNILEQPNIEDFKYDFPAVKPEI